MAKPNPPIWIQNLSKNDLHKIIAKVKCGDRPSIAKSIDFIEADSLGLWHNRARAKLCRHFKNKPPNQEQVNRLIEKIEQRLITGNFHEQFKDQLGMAVCFAPSRLKQAAENAIQNDKRYIRKYAKWVLNRVDYFQTLEETSDGC